MEISSCALDPRKSKGGQDRSIILNVTFFTTFVDGCDESPFPNSRENPFPEKCIKYYVMEIKIPPIQEAINYGNILKTKSEMANRCTVLLSRYKELYSGRLRWYTGGKATLQVREGASLVFCMARPLPYALNSRVDAELDAMLREGIIEPVACSNWATPLVPVRKADGGLRICAESP